MSGLAKILHTSGGRVAGSDRNLDGDYCKRLLKFGISIFPQDGSGPTQFLAETHLRPGEVTIVKSTAVEDQVSDIITARKLGIKEIMRSDLLADLFNAKKGIAIGGTAGKTTTTGLTAWMLKFSGLEPSCAVGGVIAGLDTNAFNGSGPHFVIEADESDGSIVKYNSFISLITNISRDHKPLEELTQLFSTFLSNTVADGTKILCGDDPQLQAIKENLEGEVLTYGLSPICDIRADNVVIGKDRISFSHEGISFMLQLSGIHNVQNALAAIAVAKVLGIPKDEVASSFLAFPGMKRRFECIGTVNGITVIDDFAHNPAEIAAAIKTARQSSKRRFIVYQPHGFGPTRFTREDLVNVFGSLERDEFLFLDDIYYGGGTVEKDISSQQIVDEVKRKFPNAFYFGDRDRIVSNIVKEAKSGDMVLVMGARDINTICRRILELLQ